MNKILKTVFQCDVPAVLDMLANVSFDEFSIMQLCIYSCKIFYSNCNEATKRLILFIDSSAKSSKKCDKNIGHMWL